jgi:DNA-binding transcriptional LysR family regulator
MAVDALNAAAIPWTEVFVGGGVATISAAVSAGLAVAALSRRVAPADTVDAGEFLGLPPLPVREMILCMRTGDRQARRALGSLTAAIRATV